MRDETGGGEKERRLRGPKKRKNECHVRSLVGLSWNWAW